MKLADNIRLKIGDDKLLHFLVFGLFTAFGFFFSGQMGILAFCIMLSLSVAKEFNDDFFNWKDLVAGVLGGLATMVIYFAIAKIFLQL